MALVWPGRYGFYNMCMFPSLLALNLNEPTAGVRLPGNLAHTWTEEEMKAKEDERWFEEGEISRGSSFHPSESITECACACLFGVN